MRVLDLFSGIGGFSLGLERAGMQTVAFCEINPFARRVLNKHWPDIPCHDDVATREFKDGEADVITAGFPCEDVSFAGNRSERSGLAGERSGLFWQVVRALRLVGPAYLLLENVAALLDRGMDTVCGALASSGYDAEWDCLPAAAIGAPHLRDRLLIVAYPRGRGIGKERDIFAQTRIETPRWRHPRGLDLAERGPWSAIPDLLRVDYGLPGTMDRLSALGKAIVPQKAEIIARSILSAQEAR